MYAGVDKYGGGVVGGREANGDNLESIIDTAGAEETIVVNVDSNTKVMLQAQLNPNSGGLMWIEVDDNKKTNNVAVAMSQMTSMLRDNDRNRKYEAAIQHTIATFIQNHHRAPTILDIGTGTGLLAMMCAKHGAKKVYACELFPTMADLATTITKANFPGIITVIPKMSTDLEIGNDKDIPHKVDMIVSEVFDSILLGEGVLPTLRHAQQELLVDTPTVGAILPGKATLFGQLVESDELFRLHSLTGTQVCDGFQMGRSDAAMRCTGGTVPLPMHVQNSVKTLSDPFTVFQFDFNTCFPSRSIRKRSFDVIPTSSGNAQCIIMWWSVHFDHGEDYSTLPGIENWQDHWVQAVFPLGKNIAVGKNDAITITAAHNDTNVWFSSETTHAASLEDITLHADTDEEAFAAALPKLCTCGTHLLCNAERIGMLNNVTRNAAYEKAIDSALKSCSSEMTRQEVSCLDISDGSLCALIASSKGCHNVTSIESKSFSALLSTQIATGNNLPISVLECGVKGILPEHLSGEKAVDILMAEPFYYAMQSLPLWQAFNYWIRRTALDSVLQKKCQFIPYRASVRIALVHFEHLAEGFGRVGTVSGFTHTRLDVLQEGNWHTQDFPYPLWMYPHSHLTASSELLSMNFSQKITSFCNTVKISKDFNSLQKVVPHAVIVWVDYQLNKDDDPSSFVSTGASNPHAKQLVRFLPEEKRNVEWKQLDASISFHVEDGKIDLNFTLD